MVALRSRDGPFRVLVVDDSTMVREVLRSMIEADPKLAVCGEAADGYTAVDLARDLRPDLVTMDLQMPAMGGMEAIAEIMECCATRILVISDVADAANCMAAVACGALDAIPKPRLDEGPALTARLRMLAGVPVIRHLRARRIPVPETALHPAPSPSGAAPERRILAIASSTGGPLALARLLPALPAELAAPVLIAQHIAEGFAGGMAQWLDGICPLSVAVASDGEPVQPGRVYLADPASHMTVLPDYRIRLCPRAERDIYRPSCDALLCSVAEAAGRHAIGVILTGMGRDGARGISAVSTAGGSTIAQDEETSVVFGMNREAIAAGGVQQVLPLDAIADALIRLAGTEPRALVKHEP